MYSANPSILAAQLGVAGILSKFKPRRLITRGGSRVRGAYPSVRFPWELSWETPQERRLIRVAELSQSILELRTQHVTLNIPEANGGFFSYTPDATAIVRNPMTGLTSGVVIECKPFDLANLDDNILKHARIRQVLAKVGIPFIVLTEEELPDSLDANLNLVLRHTRFRRRPEARRELEAKTAQGSFPRFGDLADAVGTADALHVLASGWLHFNHFEALTIQSALSNQPKEAWDAARHIYLGR